VVGALVLLGHVSLRVGVAYALAYAPNGGGIAEHASPAPNADLQAVPIRVPVGPPTATLSVWMATPADAQSVRGTIVLLHGIRLDHRAMRGFASDFVSRGYRVLLLDLRGHGSSTGTHLGYGPLEARDVSQVLDSVGARHPLGRVFVLGHSYGGAVALNVAANDPRVEGVVAVSAFASLDRVVDDYERAYVPELEPWIPKSWLRAGMNDAAFLGGFDPASSPERAVSRSKTPLLLIHGMADTQIPPDHARSLARAALGEVKLLLLADETHDSVIFGARPDVSRHVLDWLELR
jgi:pimeloyl-ACP methyl ester carboxylesterase